MDTEAGPPEDTDAGSPMDGEAGPPADTNTGQPPVERKEIVAWASYDFANSAFTTLIVTFIFSQYFAERIVDDPIRGGVLWTRAVQVSAILVALIMPVLGAIADYSGRKKRFLLTATVACVLATSALFWMKPGDALLAAGIFVFANVAYEITQAFYNSFLPEISTRRNIGRISGFGWGLGYIGGLACLALALGMVSGWLPEEDFLHVRATNLLVAGWFLLFSIPMLTVVRERAERRSASIGAYVRGGFARLGDTLGHLRQYREAAKLLIARLIYNDGLVTVFSMAAIYVGGVYGMETRDVLIMAIAVNVAAGLSAMAFGFVNDRIGGKKTIAFTIVVLIAATLFGAWAPDPKTFWIAAIAVGMMVGPNQAASRSLLGSFVPERKQGELFGFYAFSGKLASVLGPLTYGLILQATESHRLAMGSIVVFFAVGFLALMTVREEEGIEAARSLSQETGAD